ENNLCPDFMIIIGKKTYNCHLVLLRIYSKLFESRFRNDDIMNIPEDTISNSIFDVVYAWMTNEDVFCRRDQVLDLLEASDLLCCPELASSIFMCLNDHHNFSELDAFDCFLAAKKKGMHQIANLMLGRVGRSFLLVIATKEFQELNVKCVCFLLNSNYVEVQSEIETFYAALIWLYANFEQRKMYIDLVLGYIRFQLMPAIFILCLADNLMNLEPELADYLCICLDATMCLQQEEFQDTFMSDFLSTGARKWIHDRRCPYKKYLDAGNPCKLTMNVFLKYLRYLRKYPDGFLERVQETNPIFSGRNRFFD
ncbi:hypothetical protein KR009_011942, partial [Drosophila setifemur]